ncbi:MAG: hypothetical protein R6X12_08740 [bacterium]
MAVVVLLSLLAFGPAAGVDTPAPNEGWVGWEGKGREGRGGWEGAEDGWLGLDKLWHFSASFVTVGAGYHLCANRFGLAHAPAVGISIGGTFSLGIGKELSDRYGFRRRFSWKDVAANCLGIAAGYFVFAHQYR